MLTNNIPTTSSSQKQNYNSSIATYHPPARHDLGSLLKQIEGQQDERLHQEHDRHEQPAYDSLTNKENSNPSSGKNNSGTTTGMNNPKNNVGNKNVHVVHSGRGAASGSSSSGNGNASSSSRSKSDGSQIRSTSRHRRDSLEKHQKNYADHI